MTQPLQRFLGGGDALEALHEHAMRLRRIQGALETELPAALSSACGVANLKGDQLVLLARNGATAAKLRQMAPSLQSSLAARGFPIGRIQVKVQLQPEIPEATPARARTISADSLQSLRQLATSLPEASPLRASVEHLIERSRSGEQN